MNRARVRVVNLAGASSARAGLLTCLLILAALVVPASALAGVTPGVLTGANPDTSTAYPQAVTAAQELVPGTINPHGQPTSYFVEYALASAAWCTSQGASGAFSQTAPATLQLHRLQRSRRQRSRRRAERRDELLRDAHRHQRERPG